MRSWLLLVLFVAPAVAAPPPDADPALSSWFQSLAVPSTGGSCCGLADCRPLPVDVTPAGYRVLYNDEWLDVDPNAVSKRTDNPTGRYISCVTGEWNGDAFKSTVICFFPQTGT